MSTARTLVSLDGDWALAHDTDNVGIGASWFTVPPEGPCRTLQLPAMQRQGIEEHGGVGWYFKTFAFDDAWQGRFASLQIEAVNYPVQVWLNGTRLGDHPGGGAPLYFPIAAQLRAGANLLAVRLSMLESGVDSRGDVCPRYPLDAIGHAAICLAPRAHIEHVFIQPDIRRKRIVVNVEAPEGCTIDLQIEGTPCHVQGGAGELTVEFPEFVTWSAESPHCYTLQASLHTPDGLLDRVSTLFGMREFTVKDERFYLNNRPVFVKAIHYQAQYPETLRPDKLDVLLKRELDLVKESGFNAIRVESGPAPARFLDLASEVGLLVFQELPRTGGGADARAVLEALVGRDRNQPALIAWCGLSAPERAPGSLDAEVALVRALDPSRLLLCDGGQGAHTTLVRPYRDSPEPFESFPGAAAAPVAPIARDYLRQCGDPERLNVLPALAAGGVAQWDDGTKAGAAAQRAFEAEFERRQLERCFTDPERFYQASQGLQAEGLRAQLDAVRSNVKVAGYGVRSLSDGPGVAPFGVADRKRQAKPVLKSMKPVQQEVRPVIQMYKTNLVPREEVSVTILLINESRLEGRGELSLQVVGPTNQVLWKKKRLVKIPRHGRELWTGEIAASGSHGPHRFVVRLIQDHRVIGENSVALHVVQPQKAENVEINVLGARSAIRTACARLAKLHNVLAPVHIVPRLANTIRAYPANDLMQVMAQVAEGAVAIVFRPPDDWNELAEMIDGALHVRSRAVAGGGVLAHHYAKLHPVFDGLPSRDLMQQPYQNVLPLQAFAAETDEEMSGVHCRYPDGEHWWGANLIVRRLGAGRVVFTHLRVLEHLGADPVADRLFVNLLHHFSRRSVPATETLAADQKAVEWLNQERSNSLRKWMVIGSFANWNGHSGHHTPLAPENEINFDATYPGWYRAVQWKPWWTRDTERHRIDFHAALDSDAGVDEPCRYATAFAYAEFSCDRRLEVSLELSGPHAVKAWLNGTPAVDSADNTGGAAAPVWVKQGKNTLLVKCSKGPGPYTLDLRLDPGPNSGLIVNWWK